MAFRRQNTNGDGISFPKLYTKYAHGWGLLVPTGIWWRPNLSFFFMITSLASDQSCECSNAGKKNLCDMVELPWEEKVPKHELCKVSSFHEFSIFEWF